MRRTPLLRLHEVSGGNPFYALELARANPDRRGLKVAYRYMWWLDRSRSTLRP